ncbi:MAG TPA: tyrosine-type recombinase/integrase [Pirellulales bacterium]|nr:tyrosine-type recombinase/integrase [Pirellulales bacterium]
MLEHVIVASSAQAIRLTLGDFGRHLGHEPTAEDLADETLNRYLVSLEDRQLSAWTIRGHRQRIIALWNAAWMQEPPLVCAAPRRVRRIKRPNRLPEAWSVEQITSLAEASGKFGGRFQRSRISRPAFWRAFVLVAWESGLRLGDLLALKFSDIRADGVVVVTQGKSGLPVRFQVRRDTVQAIEAIRDKRRACIFGGVIGRDAIYRQFRALVAAAGLDRGTTRWLRRSSGTHVETLAPGLGHLHLGNGRDVFEKHYRDPRLVDYQVPMPPTLGVVALPQGSNENMRRPLAPMVNEYLHEHLPTVSKSHDYLTRAESRLKRILEACAAKTPADLNTARAMRYIDTRQVRPDVRAAMAGMLLRFAEWLLDTQGCTALGEMIAELRPHAVDAGQTKRWRKTGDA